MLKHTPKTTLFLIVVAVFSLAAAPLKAEEKKNLISSRYSDVLLKAQEKTREGKNKEALSLLEPFISDPEKYPVAISDYIVILVWEGRFDEAINACASIKSGKSVTFRGITLNLWNRLLIEWEN